MRPVAGGRRACAAGELPSLSSSTWADSRNRCAVRLPALAPARCAAHRSHPIPGLLLDSVWAVRMVCASVACMDRSMRWTRCVVWIDLICLEEEPSERIGGDTMLSLLGLAAGHISLSPLWLPLDQSLPHDCGRSLCIQMTMQETTTLF
jgi:hypothetical protein